MKLIVPLLTFWVAFTVPLAHAEETATQKKRSPVPTDINQRFLDADLDAEEWVKRFEGESREIFSSRKAILKAVQLKESARIADVGAGTGLFLRPFSAAVGKEGQVFAVDISPRLVEYVKKRIQDEELANAKVILSREDSTELPDASVDTVFICDTYHHFEYHADMLFSIREALRPGGTLVVIDFERIPGKSREWILGHVRAGKEEVKSEIEKSGFRFQEEVDISGLRENYFLRFVK